MTDPEKIEQLRDLLSTVVKNTKKGAVSTKEMLQTKAVLTTMLGRPVKDTEVVAAMAN